MSTIRPNRLPWLAAMALLSLAAVGCAQTSAVQYGDAYSAMPAYGSVAERPLSIGEISSLMQAGHPPEAIVAEIERRGLLAPATEADLDLLLRQGASQEIIDVVQAVSQQPPPAMAATPPATVYVPPTVVPDYTYPYPYGYGWGWGPPVGLGLGLWYGQTYRPAPPVYRPPVYRPPVYRPPGVGPGPRPGPGVGPHPGPGPRPPGGIGSDNGPPLPGLGGPRRGPDIGSDNARPAAPTPPRSAPGVAPRSFANPGAGPAVGGSFRPGLSRPGSSFGAPSSGGFRSGFRGSGRH